VRPNVLIAPCYGNRKSQKRFQDTIVNWVNFQDTELASSLDDEDLAGLSRLHPEGVARFWGARARHDRVMARISTGDVVLLTGENKIKAVGEIGYLCRNEAFADKLWERDQHGDSFVHVYTVANVRHIECPKQDLLSLPGFSPRDPLTGQRLVKPECVPDILRVFDIRTSLLEAEQETSIAERLLRRALSRVTDVERRHIDSFQVVRKGDVATARRVESALVAEYQYQCRPEQFRSFENEGIRVDLYRENGDEVEVIEAKSLATTQKVREAVGQLLDYAPHSLRPVTRLTGLFPERPTEPSVRFLHRIGIDCVYLHDDVFVREAAPTARREHMLRVWRTD
jgi:hypothetical protein